uniref:alpha-1,2-Mannosidase n=1 Tax=Aureoumbra lagunensis TaxID=44058 RepID=A0A7S3K5T7_9STRA
MMMIELLMACSLLMVVNLGMKYEERIALRDEAMEMYEHSMKSYMKHAFPYDELLPISCKGRRWDKKKRGTLDDSLGGYMLTLIDGLDTLAVMGKYDEFEEKIKLVAAELSFNRNVKVSTFEATIRVLGGLLSLHTLISEPRLRQRIFFSYKEDMQRNKKSIIKKKKNLDALERRLLELARELGERLLPAFETETGLPVHLINLKTGKAKNEQRETCTAAAGTYILEFARLSRLTGDTRFEQVAIRSIQAIWSRRSERNLIGSSIDTSSGKWLAKHTGVGAGIDSFYEYIAKAAIYLHDNDLAEIAYLAIEAADNQTTIRDKNGHEWNGVIDFNTGDLLSIRISALQAFWPSLLIFQNSEQQKLEQAQRKFSAFYALWLEFQALPDVFDLATRNLIHYGRDSPLRPELIESALHLYLATDRDPQYLHIGKQFLYSIQNISRLPCGFAAIADVASHRLDDRMDSYFLAETLKYLFLLFDLSLDPSHRLSFFCAEAQQCHTITNVQSQQINYTLRSRSSTSSLHTSQLCAVEESQHCRLLSGGANHLPHPSIKQQQHFPSISISRNTASIPACDPQRCIPMEHLILTTEGHFFDLRHRPNGAPVLGPFGTRVDPNEAEYYKLFSRDDDEDE